MKCKIHILYLHLNIKHTNTGKTTTQPPPIIQTNVHKTPTHTHLLKYAKPFITS